MSSRRLSSGDVETLGRVILADPDPEVRAAAARALARSPVDPPLDLVERAPAGPGGHPPPPVSARAAVRRRWPMAQMAALRHLPEVLEAVPARAEENLETLLSGVASMEPPPLESERAALADVARAIGADRLVAELARPGPRRLGSVRLLLMEGSLQSLRRVADLADDPVEEVRMSAAAATNILGSAQPGGSPAPGEEASLVEPSLDEIITALAGALADPSEMVRTRGREGLERNPRGTVLEWVERTLRDPDPRAAARAAAVAEALHLHPAAGPLLDRASASPAELRGPYVGALDALRIDPAELGQLVALVDPGRRHEAVRLIWLVGGRYVLPFIRTLAGDGSANVREAALEVLSEAADPATAALSEGALQRDASPAVRATAVRLLARTGGDRRERALGRALEDPDPAVRAMAVSALPADLSAGLSTLLVRALRDEDERVWRTTLPHLGGLPRSESSSLWAAFRESDSGKREEIAEALAQGVGDWLTVLAAANANAPDWAERALAIEVATRAGTEAGLALALEGFEDPDPVVRRAAAGALGALRTVHAVPALGRTLSDPQPDVRVEAVKALGLIDDDSVVPLLITALKDPAPRVRDMAARSLLRWRSPDVARLLAAALSSPDLRRQAGQILADMGEAAIEPLVDVVVELDHEVAVAAGRLLESMVGPGPFVAQLSSRRTTDRIRAVEVLAAIDGPSASEWLLASLGDPDEGVRARVVGLLAELGDPRSLDHLKHVFLNDPVPRVVAAAESALQRLGAMPADPPSGGLGEDAEGSPDLEG